MEVYTQVSSFLQSNQFLNYKGLELRGFGGRRGGRLEAFSMLTSENKALLVYRGILSKHLLRLEMSRTVIAWHLLLSLHSF